MHIQLQQIHKRYGPVHANRGVDLTVEAGTVHGVLGENGAGKSTLMKILAGFVGKTSGEILLDGKTVEFRRPADATRRGVGMLYQDPLDFPPLTSRENFLVGTSPIAYREARLDDPLGRRARELGFNLHPNQPLAGLTVGERQQLELVRLLEQGVRTLILDEPTTGISGEQKQVLFQALRALAEEGDSVVLVSHKLEDVAAVCDEVTVLRHGTVAGTAMAPLDHEHVLGMMFDHSPQPPPTRDPDLGPVVLNTHHVSALGGRSGLQECSITVHRGEVVALAGVEGSGQGVLLRVAAGVTRPIDGRVELPAHRGEAPGRWAGVTFLPAGRLEDGLVGGLSVAEHFALNQPRIPFWQPWRRSRPEAERGLAEYRVRGGPETAVEALSGGNQQRLLLSLIPQQTDLLLLENPTRGLDLESAHWVWGRLQRHVDAGAGVLFSSAELDEIMQVADRVVVFFDGRIVLDVPVAEVDVATLGAAIAGREVRP